jgi:hypothetical protein
VHDFWRSLELAQDSRIKRMGQNISSFIDFKTLFAILIGSGGLILSSIPLFLGHGILIFISNYFKYKYYQIHNKIRLI